MKKYCLSRLTVLWLVALLSTCVAGCGSSDGGGGCERVTGLADGYGDIEIHNDLGDGANVFFPEIAFGAFMKQGVCEIYGVPNGYREVEITQCTEISESDCENYGPTEYLEIYVEPGGVEVIYLGDYF